jgi:hypothetical protein
VKPVWFLFGFSSRAALKFKNTQAEACATKTATTYTREELSEQDQSAANSEGDSFRAAARA